MPPAGLYLASFFETYAAYLYRVGGLDVLLVLQKVRGNFDQFICGIIEGRHHTA